MFNLFNTTQEPSLPKAKKDLYRLAISPKCTLHLREIRNLKTIPSFEEQRDLDLSRISGIVQHYQYQFQQFQSVYLTTPIVLIQCQDHQDFLLDKKKQRCYECVVDGQHRVAALRQWQSGSEKSDTIRVPTLIHQVANLREARELQYNLFQQKPVAEIDRIQQNNYSLMDQIDRMIREWKKKSPEISKKYIREGRYTDSNRKFRKFHFLPDELYYYISNNNSIKEWVTREVQGEEIFQALVNIIEQLHSKFETLDIPSQKKFVNIPRPDHLDLFKSMVTKHHKFTLLSYHYYKNYQQLANDIILEILGEPHLESECESESEE